MNQPIVKSFIAEAVIAASRFLVMGTADFSAIQATGAGSPILGVSAPNVAVAAAQSVDTVMEGVELVECGGVVTRGLWVEPDAAGKAVNAALTPGLSKHVGGMALQSGVAGDLVLVRVQPTVIGTDGVAETEVTISTAEILALNATPKLLLAAPGAGKVHILEGAQRAFYDYNSAAYAGIAAGEDLAIKYTDGSGGIAAQFETTGFLDQTADQHRITYPAAVTPVANAALVAHMLTGEIITGNSPVKVRLRYRTVDMQT